MNRVLLPRADIATETLAEGLRERGWEIEDVTAYRTVRAAPPPAETREMIKTGGFDAVCFTSSSTVRNLVGIAGKPHARTIVACIGPKTAETAAEFGLRVDVQPETAAVGPLVDALAEHAARLRAEGALPPPRKKSRRRYGQRRRVLFHGSVRAGCAPLPAMRRLVAETSLEPRHLVLPMFVADGIDEPAPDPLDARCRAAHPRLAAPRRRRRGRRRRGRADALRRSPRGGQGCHRLGRPRPRRHPQRRVARSAPRISATPPC